MFRLVVTVCTLLVVGCAGSALKGPGGLRDDWEGIVGGVPANLGEFPSQVSLRWSGSHDCGASIVNKEWVLTAAHCVSVHIVNETSFLSGTIDIDSGEGTVHPASKVIVHPNASFHDIAVVKVSVPFDLDGVHRGAVKLPEQDQATAEESKATTIGWGATSSGGSLSNLLLKVDVLIANQEKCKSAYGGRVYPTQICAGLPEGGADSCQGDSGGPLFVDGTIVGIVSSGRGCALPGYPGIYTRVAYFRKWIEDSIAG